MIAILHISYMLSRICASSHLILKTMLEEVLLIHFAGEVQKREVGQR